MTPDDVFARFAHHLASLRALDTLSERLCGASRLLLDADGVVVTSETVPDGRITVSYTQLLSRRLASLQDTLGEGPLIETLASGAVCLGSFDGQDDHRWPALREHVAELGFAGTLIAIPLRSELDLNGALLVHRDNGSRPSDQADARFLGAAIGTAVLQDPAIGAQSHVFAEVLADRDLVHRATSHLEAAASVRYEDALALLRALAFVRGEDLPTVARAVVDGGLRTGLGD